MVLDRHGQRTVHPRRKLGETGHRRNIGTAQDPRMERDENRTVRGRRCTPGSKLAHRKDDLRRVNSGDIPQKNLEQKGETGLGLVAGKLARAMEDFSKALHADDDTTAVNVHALGKTSSGQNGCTGDTGGSDSSACVGYDTILANTRDLTKIPWFAKLKQIEQRLASLAAVELQCAAAERSAKHASERRKRHASQRGAETANEGMRKSAQGANTPAEKAQGAAQLDSKGGQTAASGDKTQARTGEACNEAHPRWHAGTRTCGDEANTATDNTVRTPNVLGSLATLATALAATTRKDVQAK
ncbi:hypothetical protein, conserved in T. vivax [Trypanosoma vivax Y486]|uniref:Trypanosome variant surface glycoprotein B-type N-terminal domain-containing protein n=1 Tax=Trypanosoma vivax (strain Y486) TaxID=1055687 RepID=F9WQ06_TRYVY|nr:hypothetical protein, conserved in T. vivax [Trypanosoma vivax Y486]|eukprot:CCD19633.1 hypothetical protein, conserved in T. vivax [Trypanosoma vivax Y486]